MHVHISYTDPELVEEYLCQRWQMKSVTTTDEEKYRNRHTASSGCMPIFCVVAFVIEVLPLMLLLPRKEKLTLLAWYVYTVLQLGLIVSKCCECTNRHAHAQSHTYRHTHMYAYKHDMHVHTSIHKYAHSYMYTCIIILGGTLFILTVNRYTLLRITFRH